ncbi:Arc family DNA-binding protein [Stutzerimonas nitrititolerans]|nr:Arc family DNA-binding protein [Stutzerimonas nitrititolerans]
MSHIAPQLKIRLPKALKDWIEREARTNCRSQTAEIVYRLEQARKQQEAA